MLGGVAPISLCTFPELCLWLEQFSDSVAVLTFKTLDSPKSQKSRMWLRFLWVFSCLPSPGADSFGLTIYILAVQHGGRGPLVPVAYRLN